MTALKHLEELSLHDHIISPQRNNQFSFSKG